MWTAVWTRARVEWTARDARVLLLLATATVVFGAVGHVPGNDGSTPSGTAGVAALTLLRLWPLLVGGLAALVAARDEEVDAPETRFAGGLPRAELAWTQAATAVVLAGGVAVASLAVTVTATAVLRGFGGGRLGVDTMVALVLSAPLWAVLGMAIGSRAGSRAKALGALAAVVLVLLLVLRLAVSIPLFRWVNVALPLGLAEALADGFGRTDLPRSVHPLAMAGFAVVDLLVPVALHVRYGRRRGAPAQGSARGSRRVLLAMVALAPVFGFVAPSAFVSVIPWRLSPTWVLDQASGSTPDVSVRAFLDALRAGDGEEAGRWTASGSVDETIGFLVDAWSPVPEVAVTLDRNAPVAGTVVVMWRDEDGAPRTLRACTARFLDGWRVLRFTSRPSCGAVMRA